MANLNCIKDYGRQAIALRNVPHSSTLVYFSNVGEYVILGWPKSLFSFFLMMALIVLGCL